LSLRDGRLIRITKYFIFRDEFFRNGGGLSGICRERSGLYFEFLPFFLALCGALQVGENYLTAMDALWLGLVDTVRADITASERREILAARP
jgi:hypothetical protein